MSTTLSKKQLPGANLKLVQKKRPLGNLIARYSYKKPPQTLRQGRRAFIQAAAGQAEKESFATDDELLKAKPVPVDLSIVALKDSVPAPWISNFEKIIGPQNKIKLTLKPNIGNIFTGLETGQYHNVDLVSIGDSWLHAAMKRNLIQPFHSAIDYRWYSNLSKTWRPVVQPMGTDKTSQKRGFGTDIWAVPYKWGCTVIAYRPDKLAKAGVPPPDDWNDLLHPSLYKRVAMLNSPRQIMGFAFKTTGLGFNAAPKDIKGKVDKIKNNLDSLVKQSLVAMQLGDAWVCVGSSQDVLALAKSISNVKFFIPRSGTCLWSDIFVIPKRDPSKKDAFGVSPLVNTWMDFVLSPARSHSGRNLANGLPASELAIDPSVPIVVSPKAYEIDAKHRFLPPRWVWQTCEFLKPIDDTTRKAYEEILS